MEACIGSVKRYYACSCPLFRNWMRLSIFIKAVLFYKSIFSQMKMLNESAETVNMRSADSSKLKNINRINRAAIHTLNTYTNNYWQVQDKETYAMV